MKIVVIGGGIIGTLIARELTKYTEDVILLEAKSNVGMGITKANSGIVHPGYDDPPGSLRAEMAYKGNKEFHKLKEELNFDFKVVGSYVVSLTEEGLKTLEDLYNRGIKNGLKENEMKIIKGKEVLEKEGNLNKEIKHALYSPITGIIDPWMVAIQAALNIEKNGAKVFKGKKVVEIERKNAKYKIICEDKSEFEADYIVNAAGLYADEIAKKIGDEVPEIFPVKGEYFLLSKDAKYVNSVIYPLPTEQTKGVLIIPTVDGGTLVGPNAKRIERKDDYSTTVEGLNEVKMKAQEILPNIDYRKYLLKTFAGLRAETKNKDFYIDVGSENVVHVSGMRSPGLTSAPYIAKYVVEYLFEEKLKVKWQKRSDFDPYQEPIAKPVDISFEEWNKLIEEDEKYGEIICFCNKVTRAEIEKAIENGARTLDDIKFMTRATFGSCQGNFCTPKIIKILIEKAGIKPEEVVYNQPESKVIYGRVRP